MSGKTLYHYTEKKNTPSILRRGLLPETGVASEEVQALARHLNNPRIVTESIYLFDKYRGPKVGMGGRSLDACVAIDASYLLNEHLYAGNIRLSDAAIESCFNLEDYDLNYEFIKANMEDIRAYEASIVPYEEYVRQEQYYGNDLELLYLGHIPPEAITLLE